MTRATRFLACLAALAPLVAGAQYRRIPLPMDPALARWIGANARSLPSVDAPYADSTWAWLDAFVGNARVLAIGENIHGGHEPLALRNHLIRYAVTHLGFTAIAIESPLSEGEVVERFIQGEGDVSAIDSVVRAGIYPPFAPFPETRELVQWMREFNATSARKVHFYGVDHTGAGADDMGGPLAIERALAWLASVDAAGATRRRAALEPFLGRFTVAGYQGLTRPERSRLHAALLALEAAVRSAGRPVAGAKADREAAFALRHAWAARRLEDAFAMAGDAGVRALPVIRFRDSVMTENAHWALEQQGPGGRAIVFAHNGHVLDVPMAFPSIGRPMRMMGQRMRARYGNAMRSIGTAADDFTGLGTVLHDASAWETMLTGVRGGTWRLDLRSASPQVAAVLDQPWVTRIHAWLQPFEPRRAMDLVVVFDTVHATRLR